MPTPQKRQPPPKPAARATKPRAESSASGRDSIAANRRSAVVKGDNFGKIITGLYIEARPRDPALRALRRYLEGLRRQCTYLPLAALGERDATAKSVTLDQVYVALNTMSLQDDPAQPSADHAPRQVRKQRSGNDKAKPLSALQAALQQPRLVLLGGPGSGKSSFVNLLAAELAKLRIERGAVTLLKGAPPDFLKQLPLKITLRELAGPLTALALDGMSEAVRQTALLKTVWARWKAELETHDAAQAEGRLRDALIAGRALVIFDGLDEVPLATRERVRLAVDAVNNAYPKARIIVTCRVLSYPSSRFDGFADVTLAQLDDDQIGAFVRSWYRQLWTLKGFNPKLAQEKIDDLLRSVRHRDYAALARESPLLLTVMAIVHHAEGRLHPERVRLYNQAIDVLLSRWQTHKGIVLAPAVAELLRDDTRLKRIMQTIAYQQHALQGQAKNPEALLPRGDILTHLEKPDVDRSGRPLAYADIAAFLDFVDQTAGLLIGQGGDPASDLKPVSYGFPHRQFQEFLAGGRMAWDSSGVQRTEFLARADEGDYWSEAARMGWETLHFLGPTGSNLMLQLMQRLCPQDEPAETKRWRATLWAGQMAALAGAEAVKRFGEQEEDSGLPERLRRRLLAITTGNTLPAIERARAGIALAALGDPRHAVLTVDAMELRPIPAGTFWMGSPQEDPEAQDRERPRHRQTITHDYKLARYPVTVAQWAEFCAAADGYGKDEWWRGLRMPKGHREGLTSATFNFANHPAHNVSWYEAVAFCRWLTARWRASGVIGGQEEVRLPTEAEWERAARGRAGEAEAYRARPWGDELDAEQANYDETKIGQTSSVGAFPAGATDWGCEEMIGNVWEWTSSAFGRLDRKQSRLVDEKGYPYSVLDGREDLSMDEDWLRVVRGGSWDLSSDFARAAFRNWFGPYGRYVYFGFRVLVGVAPVPA